MTSPDLVFELGRTSDSDLVFGESAGTPKAVSVSAAIPGPGFSALVVKCSLVTATVQLPGPGAALNAEYSSNTERPLVNRTGVAWQVAEQKKTGSQSRFARASALPFPLTQRFSRTASRHADQKTAVFSSAIHLRASSKARYTLAKAAEVISFEMPWQTADMTPRRTTTPAWENADAVSTQRHAPWQEMLRDRRRGVVGKWQDAVALPREQKSSAGSALPVPSLQWRGRWQEAMRPPAGIWIRPQPPIDPPTPGRDPNLVFVRLFPASPHLVFGDDIIVAPPASVIVPIRSVYVVINNVTLKRVSDNTVLPTYGMSLTIDADSWSWGFSASLWATALDAVMPSPDPVEVEALINGSPYRFIVESISRERQFGNATVRIEGRSKSAVLAAPYSPVLSFINSQQRTAQQLMLDVLSDNGVPMNWTIDWQLTDWLVPAGAFSVQGSRMDGLLAVANAAGAYLQPHATAPVISVLHRYPVAPWLWNTVIPDFELPSAVTTSEGIEWIEKPAYNRVFVSGTSQGVIGQVTITGSGGTLSAPMVTDPLITHADAARQRGVAVLGDTGRQARVSLRLPVLAEAGIIMPGKFVSYVDSEATRTGIVRSTSVEAGFPDVFQSLIVETHL